MNYDRFQQEAIDHINQGFSVIVSAPTGAGKTAIAEHVITTCLQEKVGVVYTAPIKALSNQKFRDFQATYADHIGILTGDVSINPDAPVLIMTTEIFRNKILDEPESLNKYSWIIYDEVHYIDNYERGTVWEESLVFLPRHMKLLALSATIPNIDELAAWIESIHAKPIKTVVEKERPVPLHFLFQCNNEIIPSWQQLKKTRGTKPNRISSLIHYIREQEGLPCIYFVFGRRRAEDLAFELQNYNFLNHQEQKQICLLYDDLVRKFGLERERSAIEMYPLVRHGIAFHHAGMLPTLKEVIERLFTSRLLKVIFTTETFALGINMPSRSVVFDELRKYYGKFVRSLKTRDFYQMAGRAGRRGIDKEGFVYSRINLLRIRFDEVKEVIYGPPEEVRSQLNTSYATVLNLYEIYKDKIFDIYPRSLHFFQSRKNQQREALRLLDAKVRLLKDWGYIQGEALTNKGQFAKTVYGNELLLSELYQDNILEQLDEFGLGIVSCAAVFEPRKNQMMPHISRPARQIQQACEEIFAEIQNKERKFRIYPFSKQPYFHLSNAIEGWLQGTSFDKVRQLTDVDEGEIVRYFRMSIQILREVDKAKVASHLLKERIRNTVTTVNRDLIDAERQLREG